MLVKLGLGFGLRSITDMLGIARREFGCVKIPLVINAYQIGSDADSKPDHIESDTAGHPVEKETAIYMDFVGSPFPIGSTIPICLDLLEEFLVLEEFTDSSRFYQTFYESNYEDGWIQKEFLSLSVKTLERRSNEYFQQTEPLKLRMDSVSAAELNEVLRKISWNLIRDEAKFFEFAYSAPESDRRISSVDLPAISRTRNIF